MRPLTEAEFKIMCHLAAGRTRAEVARTLGISESTLRDRTTAIRTKLNASTFTEALEAWKRVSL